MRLIINLRRAAFSLGCLLAVLALIAGGCGNDDAADTSGTPTVVPTTPIDTPAVVVTTSIWGDVVANVACDGLADVTTLIPPGGDPHAFQPSLQDRGRMESAALVVTNGLHLEEGLEDTLEAVEESGTPVFHMADHISTIEYGSMNRDEHEDEHGHEDDEHEDEHGHEDDEHEDEHGHEDDEHEDEHGHEDDEHEDEHGHAHGGADPHVWFDPIRVADALPALSQALATQAGLDAGALQECVAAYRSELIALDAEVEEILAPLHSEDRLLITNHDALGYFANRYGFQLIGTVIPGGSTLAEANPAGLQELVHLIEETGVAAIFSETTHSTDDADALGRAAGVKVLSLNTGSLGPAGSGADTYIGFMRTNAQVIIEGLG
ncbi:metal ABC transporter substrate-binding protein [Candidatus Poriferisocius sp.]|uniref:metal ABC transporter substrate-binding protein n=1 Tax=Candidatus Poriferisocius sp. TaxID=3101276 RepID=UPI003B01BA5E